MHALRLKLKTTEADEYNIERRFRAILPHASRWSEACSENVPTYIQRRSSRSGIA